MLSTTKDMQGWAMGLADKVRTFFASPPTPEPAPLAASPRDRAEVVGEDFLDAEKIETEAEVTRTDGMLLLPRRPRNDSKHPHQASALLQAWRHILRGGEITKAGAPVSGATKFVNAWRE